MFGAVKTKRTIALQTSTTVASSATRAAAARAARPCFDAACSTVTTHAAAAAPSATHSAALAHSRCSPCRYCADAPGSSMPKARVTNHIAKGTDATVTATARYAVQARVRACPCPSNTSPSTAQSAPTTTNDAGTIATLGRAAPPGEPGALEAPSTCCQNAP